MKFTESDLNRLATDNVLKHYITPEPDDERHRQTRVEYYPEEPYFDLRGIGRDNHMEHITVSQALSHVHPHYREDAMMHFNALNACTEDYYQFYMVASPWNTQYEYRVMVVTLYAVYDDNSERIIRYTGNTTDVTNEVYDRRINLKLKQKSSFIDERFKTALWSVDPDDMMLYCDKVGHDDFYHDYNAYDFIEMVHPDYQVQAEAMMSAMHVRDYDMSPFVLRIYYPDGSEHYLQCKVDTFLDDKGSIFRYLIYSYDVTEQKKLEFKNQTFHEHLHKMMVESGIHLFYYTPGSEKLHMEDPLADSRLVNIDIGTYMERVHPYDRIFFKDIFQHCDKRNFDRQEFTYRLMPYDASVYHHYRNIVLPVFNEKNELLMYGFIRMDVTHVERLAREKEKADMLLHTVLRHFPSMVFVKDVVDDFRIVAANEAYAHFFDKPLSEIEGKRLKDYSNVVETDEFIKSDFAAAMCTADNPMIEFFSKVNKMGERRYYQKSKFGQMVGDRKLLICTATDVTELHQAKVKAEQSDRLKSAFLANMSHEIRTPLNAIVGFSDLIASNDCPEEKNEFVRLVHSNSEQLLRLISDILDISKLEANVMKYFLTDFDINGMLKDTYLGLQDRFKNKPIDFVYMPVDKPLKVHQDRVRVEEIVNNFLTNAYKNTDAGTIRMWLETKDNHFRILVSDTGKGIPDEKQKTIFNRFEKLDDFKEGTGLGLAICRGITDALGGTIGVDSKVGAGSTFWVELPIYAHVSK